MCILLGEYPGSIEKLIKMPVGGFRTITTLLVHIFWFSCRSCCNCLTAGYVSSIKTCHVGVDKSIS